MNCKEFRDGVDSEFEAGLVDFSSDIKQHADSCSVCAAYLRDLMGLKQILAQDRLRVQPGDVGHITFERIVAASAEAPVRRKSFFVDFPKWAWAPLAAAAIIVMVIFIPRFVDRPIADYSPALILYEPTGQEMENAVLSSDELGDEFLSSFAGNAADINQLDEDLIGGNSIDEMINSLSDTELEALEAQLTNLKG